MAGADATLKIDINISQVEKKLSKTEQRLKKVKDLAASLGKAETALFDGRSIKGGNKALEELAGKLKAASQSTFKFANNVAGLDKQVGKLQSVIRGAKTDTDEFRNAIAAAERAQMSLFRARGSVMKTRGQDLMGGLTGDLPGKLIADSSSVFRSIDALRDYRDQLTRIFNAVEIGSPVFKQLETEIKKVNAQLEKPKDIKTPNITRGIGGLAGREQGLKEAKRTQESINALSIANIKATIGVKQAQFAYNAELLRSKATQVAINADINATKGLWSGVTNVLKGIGGLLGGKAGRLGQAAGIIGVSDAVQRLIKIIPGLNQVWKQNILTTARWVQRATEGITAVSVAYQGLSTLLGGAGWVIGAISGFKKFESQAAQSIWNTTRAVKNFYESISAMALMMQGKGGTPSGVGQLLKDMALGGEERQESKRYAQQGPTGKETIQKDLDLQITKLKQRNLNEKDYIQILQRKFKLERELRRENRKEQVMQVKAGQPFEEVFEKEINAYKSRVEQKVSAEKRAENQIRSERAKRAKANKQQLMDELRDIKTAEKEELQRINRVMAADAKAHKKALAMEQQRKKARKDRMGRLGENLMLGAGFPMLFGGGAGAVAGGTLGALTQSAMGSGGFGAQILFSALGQQFDAFAKKTATLGQAFTALDKDTTPLLEALGKTGSEFEKQIQTLEKLGQSEKAFALARDEMIRLVGTEGVNSLSEFGENTKELTNSWNRFMTQVGAGLAGLVNAAGILKGLIQGLDNQELLTKAQRNEGGDQKLSDIQSQIDRYGLPAGDPMKIRMGTKDFPSLPDLTNQLRERQKILETQEVEKANEQIIQALKVGSVAATVDEITHLERSLAIGVKRADREKEVHEILKEQGMSLLEMTATERDRVRTQLETRDALKAQLEIWGQIKDTIATGLTSAIEGLIAGTKSLGESLTSIARSIGSMLLQAGISSFIGGMGAPKIAKFPTSPVIAAQGMYMANGIKPFASGGMATRPTLGLVGEAGEDEYIIPASKMASSMQRYSAGARGEAVIPGTGSSSGGAAGGSSTTVSYSGPILSFNSEDYVPKSAVGQIIATATSQGARAGENRTLSTLRNSRSARSRLGM